MSKTVVITGISRGIGLELAKSYLKNGDTVHGTIRKPNPDVEGLQKKFLGKLQVHTLDVTNASQVKSLGAMFEGSVDLLINNAGALSGYQTKFSELEPDELSKIFDVNVNGPLRVTQALMPALQKASEPKLIHISSKVGSIADNAKGGAYAYRISKTALNMLSKNISLEFPQITNVVMHPGWAQTDMGGTDAPLTPENSAKGIAEVIAKLKKADTGGFFDYQGKEIPW